MSKRQRKTFTSAMDEMLIEYVRGNKALYDLSNKKYSDNQYKSNVWTSIGEKLELDGQECKHRWEAIRGQYRKFRNSKKTKTEQAADPNARWKYGDILEFLHMKDKERVTPVTTTENLTFVTEDKSNGPENISQYSDSSQHIFSQDNIQDITPKNSQLDGQDILQSTDLSQASTSQQANHKSKGEIVKNKKATTKTIKDKAKSSTQSMTASSTLMNYHLTEKNNKKIAANKDEIDLCFESIKATVKKFSPGDKHLDKTKIFGLVSDIEAKYVYDQRHTQNFSAYNASNMQTINLHNTAIDSSEIRPPLVSPTPHSSHSSNFSLTPIQYPPSSSASMCQSYNSSLAASFYETFSPQNTLD